MQSEQYTRTKGPTIVEGESSWNGPKSLVEYRARPSKRRRGSTPDYLPYWQWALIKQAMEMNRPPNHLVVDHLHSRRKSKWHTQIVIVTTLIVAPIVLRMIPFVLDFYLGR